MSGFVLLAWVSSAFFDPVLNTWVIPALASFFAGSYLLYGRGRAVTAISWVVIITVAVPAAILLAFVFESAGSFATVFREALASFGTVTMLSPLFPSVAALATVAVVKHMRPNYAFEAGRDA